MARRGPVRARGIGQSSEPLFALCREHSGQQVQRFHVCTDSTQAKKASRKPRSFRSRFRPTRRGDSVRVRPCRGYKRRQNRAPCSSQSCFHFSRKRRGHHHLALSFLVIWLRRLGGRHGDLRFRRRRAAVALGGDGQPTDRPGRAPLDGPLCGGPRFAACAAGPGGARQRRHVRLPTLTPISAQQLAPGSAMLARVGHFADVCLMFLIRARPQTDCGRQGNRIIE